jgi:hypothetical protein
VHVPGAGTIQALRLESPPAELVRKVVEQRLRPALEELPDHAELSGVFPFTDEQVERIARTEPTLRDMLQQFRHLFDHVVYGASEEASRERERPEASLASRRVDPGGLPRPETALPGEVIIKSVTVVETPADPPSASPVNRPALLEMWDQEVRAARRRLEPEGALTGATRELQAGLGLFLQVCHEHGVKVGPWRMQHVVPEWTFGDHPTYGALAIAHWVCKDGQPWKLGIGLFLGKGAAKPRDLGTKLEALKVEPPVIDYLILLRPEDDLALSGKSKTLWQEAEKAGHHIRLEAVTAEAFALLSSLPRWLAALTETLPAGSQLPNLADLIQDRCERLLEQVCMPVHG